MFCNILSKIRDFIINTFRKIVPLNQNKPISFTNLPAMKEELLKALTAKFPGVSASILGRIADKLSKTATTAEQVKTAVDGITIQQVIESYADSRATEASETAHKNAVQDYEQKYGLKDGAKITQTTQTGGNSDQNKSGGNEEMPAWAKAFMERMDKFEATRTTESRRQKLTAVIEKLPEALRNAYNRLPVDKYSDTEFDTLVAEVTTEAEKAAQEITARGAVFGKPGASGGSGSQQNGELTKEQQDAIAHRDGAATKDGVQPF
jgi:hypothetical protein